MPSKILKCNCEHKSQDELYGKGMRVFNKSTKGLRCTICGNLKKDDSQPSK